MRVSYIIININTVNYAEQFYINDNCRKIFQISIMLPDLLINYN